MNSSPGYNELYCDILRPETQKKKDYYYGELVQKRLRYPVSANPKKRGQYIVGVVLQKTITVGRPTKDYNI